ncbi:MAG: sigma-70 family RNA polymerase sigma factor [Rhizobiales bacterium]|nr:sigma-70 family RNA polymerase sigma factor [Hyphomicrobiales bacterium]
MTRKPLPVPAPVFDKAQNLSLAAQYHATRAPRLLDQLVKNHTGLVVRLAKTFGRYDISLDDIISEGTLALVQAIHAFDPAKAGDASFATYATYWIRTAIKDYIMRNHSIVAVTPTGDTKRAFFRVRFERNKLAEANAGVLPHDYQKTIADKLGISIATVRLVEARLARDVSADAPLPYAEDGTLVETFSSTDPVLEPAPTPEDLVSDIQERDYLRSLIKGLTDRERQIVTERVLAPDPPTIARLAEKLGITPQRVHQLETRALKKLKAASTGLISIEAPTTARHTDA